MFVCVGTDTNQVCLCACMNVFCMLYPTILQQRPLCYPLLRLDLAVFKQANNSGGFRQILQANRNNVDVSFIRNTFSGPAPKRRPRRAKCLTEDPGELLSCDNATIAVQGANFHVLMLRSVRQEATSTYFILPSTPIALWSSC